jgi:hypothetical protein
MLDTVICGPAVPDVLYPVSLLPELGGGEVTTAADGLSSFLAVPDVDMGGSLLDFKGEDSDPKAVGFAVLIVSETLGGLGCCRGVGVSNSNGSFVVVDIVDSVILKFESEGMFRYYGSW